jgi:hypothetical protein
VRFLPPIHARHLCEIGQADSTSTIRIKRNSVPQPRSSESRHNAHGRTGGLAGGKPHVSLPRIESRPMCACALVWGGQHVNRLHRIEPVPLLVCRSLRSFLLVVAALCQSPCLACRSSGAKPKVGCPSVAKTGFARLPARTEPVNSGGERHHCGKSSVRGRETVASRPRMKELVAKTGSACLQRLLLRERMAHGRQTVRFAFHEQKAAPSSVCSLAWGGAASRLVFGGSSPRHAARGKGHGVIAVPANRTYDGGFTVSKRRPSLDCAWEPDRVAQLF